MVYQFQAPRSTSPIPNPRFRLSRYGRAQARSAEHLDNGLAGNFQTYFHSA